METTSYRGWAQGETRMGLVNGNGSGPLSPARFGIIKPGVAERGQSGESGHLTGA